MMHFKFSPRILQRLGEELVPNPDQGIIELVKNSYDADATECTVELIKTSALNQMKMMDSPELIILDVGHGNCALIRDANDVMVIDCPPGGTLAETLEYLSIKEILHILISHSDADHIAGMIDLLANEDIKIHNVHINPNAIKRSEIWLDLRSAFKDARQRFGTNVSIDARRTTYTEMALHKEFIINQVTSPICRKFLSIV